jgi:hypothetical protein
MSIQLHNILFLDIETVPQHDGHESMPDEWKTLWDLKASYLIRNKESETSQSIYARAGIYAEFGKVICISCGVMQGTGQEKKLISRPRIPRARRPEATAGGCAGSPSTGDSSLFNNTLHCLDG